MQPTSPLGVSLSRPWALPLLGATLLAVAPFLLGPFNLNLLGQFLAIALAALGLDILWGYGGMLSLGQGVFFSLGAYAMAMHLKLVASGRSLPDFMGWDGVTSLPWFWAPFHSAAVAVLAAILVPGVLAGLLGLAIFRQRVRGVYFSILTQALTVVLSTLFIGEQGYTGGTNGITNFTTFLGLPLSSTRTGEILYGVTAVLLIVSYLLVRRLLQGRLGHMLVAIRDAENRVRFLGHDPAVVKAFTFALASALAGLGGALYVTQIGIISPQEMGVVPSIELVIMVALGGRGSLVGPILGAIAVKFLENQLNTLVPGAWQYILGGLFVLVVLALPQGVAGLVRQGLEFLVRVRARPTHRTETRPTAEDAAGAAAP